MYRTAPSDGITAERALAEAGALDLAHETLSSVREIDAVLARIDVELRDESGARARTTEVARSVRRRAAARTGLEADAAG